MTAHKIAVIMYSRLRRDRLPELEPVTSPLTLHQMLEKQPMPTYMQMESEVKQRKRFKRRPKA